jgi:hypothetical protein
MIEIYEKRGRWCYRDEQGKLFKFNTETEAKSSLGLETIDNAKEKIETEDSEEKTDTNKQKTVRNSKSSNKKKV